MKFFVLRHPDSGNWISEDSKKQWNFNPWTDKPQRRRLFRRVSDYRQCKHYTDNLIVEVLILAYPDEVLPSSDTMSIGAWDKNTMPDGLPRSVFIRPIPTTDDLTEYIHISRVVRK